MWALKNYTAYAADRTWVRDKTGAHHWIVAVKATFDITSKGLQLADTQPSPLLEPQYWGDPAASSLRYDADLVQSKPTTDLIINAHAYAPRGQAARSVLVGVRTGNMRKELVVHGPRIYHRGPSGLTISAGKPFTVQPIIYEWSYGGSSLEDPDPRKRRIDSYNPVGKGVAVRTADLIGQPAHQIEYPARHASSAEPAGLGAIASHWSPRRELAGTYDADWERTRRPLLAVDYDERFVLCSPTDQRPLRHLNGGELIELSNVTHEGVLSVLVPKIYLTFSTRFGSRNKEHRGKIACVIIEPEYKRLMVIWQTALGVGATDADYLDATIIREKPYLT